MTFEEATRQAALVAKAAVNKTTEKLRRSRVDEDDLTGILVGRLEAALDGTIGGLEFKSNVLRHRRGKADEERRFGADLLLHVVMDTPTQKYSKGVLIQAKKVGPNRNMSSKERRTLTEQCEKMLSITPASFVIDYGEGEARYGSASRIAGATSHNLYAICGWTTYRFFLEFFRSPIGDTRIRSELVEDLPAAWGLDIQIAGELSNEHSSPFPFR